MRKIYFLLSIFYFLFSSVAFAQFSPISSGLIPLLFGQAQKQPVIRVEMITAPFRCIPCDDAKAYFGPLAFSGKIKFDFVSGSVTGYPHIKIYVDDNLVAEFEGFSGSSMQITDDGKTLNDIINAPSLPSQPSKPNIVQSPTTSLKPVVVFFGVPDGYYDDFQEIKKQIHFFYVDIAKCRNGVATLIFDDGRKMRIKCSTEVPSGMVRVMINGKYFNQKQLDDFIAKYKPSTPPKTEKPPVNIFNGGETMEILEIISTEEDDNENILSFTVNVKICVGDTCRIEKITISPKEYVRIKRTGRFMNPSLPPPSNQGVDPKKPLSQPIQGGQFNNLLDSVVRLEYNAPGIRGFGSGAVVGDGMHIVTAAHVITSGGGIDSVVVITNDGKQYAPKLIAIDTRNDVAILKISPPKPLDVIPIASQPPTLGEEIVAFGCHPGQEKPHLCGGARKIIKVGVKLCDFLGEEANEVSGRFEVGVSGGPVVNEKGELIGVVSQYCTHRSSNGEARITDLASLRRGLKKAGL